MYNRLMADLSFENGEKRVFDLSVDYGVKNFKNNRRYFLSNISYLEQLKLIPNSPITSIEFWGAY